MNKKCRALKCEFSQNLGIKLKNPSSEVLEGFMVGSIGIEPMTSTMSR